jgi:hypothetical protein
MSEPGADDSTASARRTLAFFVVAVLTLVAGLAVVLVGDDVDDVDDAVAPARRAVGPGPGTDVGSYVEARRARLAEVEGVHAAVVSFGDYLDPEGAAEVLEGIEVLGWLVAWPRDEPRVTTDVEATRATVRSSAEMQIAEIGPLVPTVDDPEFAEFYRAELLRYRAVLAKSSLADVVFGAVVEARASELRGLASRPSVRLVDLAGSVDVDPELARGLRPEETVSAGRPRFRP